MADDAALAVEVVYALAQEQTVIALRMPSGATVADAIAASGLEQRYPETAAAPVGTQFSMGWGCPVPGSEIAAVQWSALRYAAEIGRAHV